MCYCENFEKLKLVVYFLNCFKNNLTNLINHLSKN